MIEKNIITTLKNIDDIIFNKHIENEKLKNKDFNFFIYSNDDVMNYLESNHIDMMPYINSIDKKYFVAIVDIFRLLWVYDNGGIWIDHKTKINYNYTEILKDYNSVLFSSIINKRQLIRNNVFAFKKKSQQINKIIDVIKHRIENYNKIEKSGFFKNFKTRDKSEYNKILYVTGPRAFRHGLKKEKIDKIYYTTNTEKIITESIYGNGLEHRLSNGTKKENYNKIKLITGEIIK